MTLSILIVNWNTKNLASACLNSILRSDVNFEYEIILLDNNSSDGSFEYLKTKFGDLQNIHLIQSEKNLGFAMGNNHAYKYANGDYVLLLNPDTEVKKHALQSLVDFIREHKNVGIVGPKLTNPDQSLQPSVRRFPDVWSSLLIFSGLHRIFTPKKYLMSDFDYEKSAQVDQVMGAALLTRRDLIESYGLFDERYYLWYEEVDFCKKIKDAGYDVMYFNQAEVMHVTAQSFSQLAVFDRKKTVAKSLRYYFSKHGSLFERFLLNLLMIPVLFVAWVFNLIGFKTRIKV